MIWNKKFPASYDLSVYWGFYPKEPLKLCDENPSFNSPDVPFSIKRSINKRNRLLKSNNHDTNLPLIKNLNCEIRKFFHEKKTRKVQAAARGEKSNIWKAVKLAKNLSNPSILCHLTLGGVAVAPGQAADSLAGYFHNKVLINLSW